MPAGTIAVELANPGLSVTIGCAMAQVLAITATVRAALNGFIAMMRFFLIV